MTLYNDLVTLGVLDNDALLLEQRYGNEPDFVQGLESMTTAYFTDSKPAQIAAGEPWRTIGAAIAGNGQSPKNAIECAINALDPAVKLPLFDTMVKLWGKLSILQQSAPQKGKRNPKTAEYIQALQQLGYSFRMNECLDETEVNGEAITDALRAEIRARMRDKGYGMTGVMEDAYTAHAHHNRYHPVREYLAALAYDGGNHIEQLSSCFQDRDGVFPVWLRRWLIGAVAKAHSAEQNYMLVLDGKQGIGKSHFARWMGAALPDYFVEGPINPEDKDCHIRLVSNWVWEVAELGSTTRKADRESLKFFISQRTITIRRPYGRYDIRKPALASFIGTVNNESGILSDKTGNRRFLVSSLESIDWSYSDLDVSQVWAEAQALYLAGEPWRLTPDEAKLAGQLNEDYEVEDPVEGLLLEYFEIDPQSAHWTPTAVILQTLEANGLRGQTRANSMALSAVLKKLGLEKSKRQNGQGARVWGYEGIRYIGMGSSGGYIP